MTYFSYLIPKISHEVLAKIAITLRKRPLDDKGIKVLSEHSAPIVFQLLFSIIVTCAFAWTFLLACKLIGQRYFPTFDLTNTYFNTFFILVSIAAGMRIVSAVNSIYLLFTSPIKFYTLAMRTLDGKELDDFLDKVKPEK